MNKSHDKFAKIFDQKFVKTSGLLKTETTKAKSLYSKIQKQLNELQKMIDSDMKHLNKFKTDEDIQKELRNGNSIVQDFEQLIPALDKIIKTKGY